MFRKITTTAAVLSSVVEMLQDHIGEAPNIGTMDGIQALGDALNAIAVTQGGSTDRPVIVTLQTVEA